MPPSHHHGSSCHIEDDTGDPAASSDARNKGGASDVLGGAEPLEGMGVDEGPGVRDALVVPFGEDRLGSDAADPGVVRTAWADTSWVNS
jgi:hypothetical protein